MFMELCCVACRVAWALEVLSQWEARLRKRRIVPWAVMEGQDGNKLTVTAVAQGLLSFSLPVSLVDALLCPTGYATA